MLTINLEHLNIQPNHRILDLGCGEGRHAISAYLLSNAEHIVAVDLSIDDIHIARQRLSEFESKQTQQRCDMFVADGLRLPFADQSFDIVICSEVLEHIPEYTTMLNEISRITKPKGIAAVSVPRAWPERICWRLSKAYHHVKGGHIRIFQAALLQKDIEKNNFQLIHKHWAHALHSPYWWLRCLFWRTGEQVFLVTLYHKILVWDLLKKPWVTQTLEKQLNPFLGKSVVMYFKKQIK